MFRFYLWVSLGFLILAGNPATATILTFDITDPIYPLRENFPEGETIDQTYGDRVNSLSTSSGGVTFAYGAGAEGFTPNITVSYDPGSIFTGGPSLWRYDYGNLTRVLYQGSTNTGLGFDYNYLTVTFTADPGYDVVLFGFDLGGWNQTDRTVNAVAVYNNFFNGFFPADNRVFLDANATVLGAGPTHSTYTFNSPIRANVVTILIEADNLGADSELVGIDNIRFGQDLASTPTAVPEPGTLGMAAIALLAIGATARSRA
ncbi:MAG: PEP-CTERM sorting domain-containing protein [Bryobacterales bacterium]|nr:PEP-CTERM sorting domain-containing protein [Bryobacterales bacterium]